MKLRKETWVCFFFLSCLAAVHCGDVVSAAARKNDGGTRDGKKAGKRVVAPEKSHDHRAPPE
jgi:hypothetical protein